MNNLIKYYKHWIWNFCKLGILIFPLFPALGGFVLGIILIYIWMKEFSQIIRLLIAKGFFFFSIGLIIISILAKYQKESFLGLANFLPFSALFLAFIFMIKKAKQLRQLAWILVVSSPIVVILGLGQLFFNWHSPNLFFGWELMAQGNPEGRMSSIFTYANILAIYLIIVFILAIGLWLEKYQDWQKNKLILGFLTIAIVGNSIGLILTSSRNAWAIAFLAALSFAIYLGWYWLVFIFSAAVTIVLGASFAPQPINNSLRYIVPEYFWGRLSDQMYPNRPLETLRLTQWRFSWDLTMEHPLTGWGLRNFSPLYEAKMNVWLGHPHNFFLMLTAETGLILTVMFCGLIAYILAQGILFLRKIQAKDRLILFTYLVAFSSCIIFNLFDVTLFDLRINTLTWLLLAGIYGVTLHKNCH